MTLFLLAVVKLSSVKSHSLDLSVRPCLYQHSYKKRLGTPRGALPMGGAQESYLLYADHRGALGKLLPCSGHISADATWSHFPCKPVNFFFF